MVKQVVIYRSMLVDIKVRVHLAHEATTLLYSPSFVECVEC